LTHSYEYCSIPTTQTGAVPEVSRRRIPLDRVPESEGFAMRRFSEEELRRLKEESDLAALVRASGVELKAVGKDLRGRCPFHDDKGPSLVVTPAKGLWHCLGACGVGGSAIDWVMKSRGVSFTHAVETLRSRGAAEPVVPTEAKASSVRRLPAPVSLDADDRSLLLQVVDYYHETLKTTPQALDYLRFRGLVNSELVGHFNLGYSNRTLGYRLPERNRKTGAELRDRLVKIGIYRESGHEHFSGSLVVPVFDETGAVVGAYGRKVVTHLKAETPKHLYLPGPHRGVWNLPALQASREIILCEALIDAMTFWSAGFRNVTSSYGVHGFTADHLAAFQKHGVEKVLVAYDRDDAGDRAAAELAPRLAEAGIDVFRILFPRGMDANEYARKVTPAEESLGVAIRSAQFVMKGKRAAPMTPPAPPPPEPIPLAAPPEPPAPEAPVQVAGDEVKLTLGDREYRVRGLSRNLSMEALRINVRASRGEKYHVDTFDLLAARPRALYVKQAADELGVAEETVKKDLGKLLLELETLQEKRIREASAPRAKEVVLSESEKAEALELLRDPRLLDRIVGDFERIGLCGEETNKLVGYLAAVSRKMDEPLAVLIQSNSAAGKSVLMDAILEMAPEEDVERYTAMTGQSLYYMADSSLRHKILSIAEVMGAERAGYAIKMLQSEGKISIATTVKDPETGDLRTKKHEVEGPVAILLTTTEAQIDEELQNRAIVLTVNEDRAQTKAIHEAQRRAQTLQGMLRRQDREKVLRLHRNAQRLLKPLLVVNPFADRLTFLDTKLRTRRDHVKYLTLIRAIALLHQYQRPLRQVEHQGRIVPYLEVTLDDVAIANRLAGEVLGRSLDELAPQTRRLLVLLDQLVTSRCQALKLDREDYRFTRREVREFTHWSHSQLGVHLVRLVDLEYLLVHRGGRGQGFVYELLYDGSGPGGGRFLPGLLDPARLRHDYNSNLPAQGAHLPGGFRGASGPVPGGFRGAENGGSPDAPTPSADPAVPSPQTHGYGADAPKAAVHAGDP
jgi:DNA primase catalytic core